MLAAGDEKRFARARLPTGEKLGRQREIGAFGGAARKHDVLRRGADSRGDARARFLQDRSCGAAFGVD